LIPFRKQIKQNYAIYGFHPLIIKTSQPGVFFIRARPEILVFFLIKGLNLLGPASKSNFWQYFNCVIKGKLIDFEIKEIVFY